MQDKAKFLEKLNGLLVLAKGQGSQITIEEVKAYFCEDALTEEQMELVFDYLMTQKVAVKGYVKLASDADEVKAFSEEEEAYLREYEQDLKAIRPADDDELHNLYEQVVSGDDLAKTRLMEVYLQKVVAIAKKMHSGEVFLGDLIQEGNLGLVLGVEFVTDVKTAKEVIEAQIKQSISLLLEEQSELKSRDKKMVEKVQALDEAITTLTEELGRKVSIDELAIYMGMEIEEIEDILKLTGEETTPEEEEA